MTDKLMIPPQGGIWREFILRLKLILRLIGDRRVNPFLKILPIGGILYLFSPLDLIPDIALPIIGELDDAAILWLTNYLFIELCPPEVVREHVKALSAENALRDGDEEIVDAETKDITDEK